jgi:hypothetical protein
MASGWADRSGKDDSKELPAKKLQKATYKATYTGSDAARPDPVIGSARWLRAVAVAAQIGRSDGEALRERWRNLVPPDQGPRIAMQQQQGRATGDGNFDLGARSDHPPPAKPAHELVPMRQNCCRAPPTLGADFPLGTPGRPSCAGGLHCPWSRGAPTAEICGQMRLSCAGGPTGARREGRHCARDIRDPVTRARPSEVRRSN